MIDIPEEEARYWTYKLEQINALEADNEVGTALFAIWRDREKSLYRILVLNRGACEHVEE